MSQADLWRPGDKVQPGGNGQEIAFPPEVLKTITDYIDKLDRDLRDLSLDISGTPPPRVESDLADSKPSAHQS